MSLPPSEFAETFRAHVLPRVRQQIQVQGILCGLRFVTPSEAFDEVITFAFDWRAGQLPEEHFGALEDWVWDTLTSVILQTECATEDRQKQNQPVTADIEGWNSAVLKAFGCGE